MSNTAQTRSSEPWAIALVHGIGTTSPLPMIQEVSAALKTARPDLKLDTDAEVHEVPEAGGIVRHNVIRHGKIGDADLRIGTAHWADITFYRRGLVSMIGALMMTAFGVRFFAQVAATAIPGANWLVKSLAYCLRHVLQLMVRFLAIVIFPVTFVALVFSCMGLLGEYVFKVKASFAQKEAIAIFGFIICFIVSWLGISRTWAIRNERPLSIGIFGSIILVSFTISLLLLVGDYIWISKEQGLRVFWHYARGDESPFVETVHRLPIVLRDWLSWLAHYFNYKQLGDRIAYVDRTAVYFAMLHCLQIGAGIVMISMTLVAITLLALLIPVAKLSGTRVRTFVFATVSVISIWIINLILLWPENLATFAAMIEFLDDTKMPRLVAVTTIDWWRLTSQTSVLDLSTPITERTGFMFMRHYRDTYPLMWFETAFLVFLFATLVLVLAVLAARLIWCSRQSRANLACFAVLPGDSVPLLVNWPRVIISRGYVVLVLLLIIFVPYTFFAMSLRDSGLAPAIPALSWIGDWLPTHEISVGAEWARVLLVLFLVLFSVFSHYISDGAKLVLDVVNHFTAPDQEFPVRQRIARRFEEMIETLLAENDNPHLVIIAHSQGTVITVDALRRTEWTEKTLKRVRSLTVLTFGSPVTHVYQEYFPQLYPKLSETPLNQLSEDRRVRWFNTYRIDDYVGTYIDPSIRDFPVNVPAPKGGHTDYWEADVMEQLFATPGMRDVLAGR